MLNDFERTLLDKVTSLEHTLNELQKDLKELTDHVKNIQKDTEKNAEVAAVFNKYKPTIDKVESGLNSMMNPRSWIGYYTHDQIEDNNNSNEA